MKRILFALALLSAPLCLVLSLVAQQVVVTPYITPAASITVTASPSTIRVGGTSQLSAQLYNPSPNIFRNDCPFQSSNTAIFTVSGNVVTGVAAGTANATCTIGGITGAAQIIVAGSPVFTNPSQASCGLTSGTACVLPAGQISVAYSTFTFTATTTPPNTCCTFAVTTGSLPTGLSLASGGALTGTPTGSAGTSTFQVTATDSGSNTTIQYETLTITSAATCATGTFGGPPNYSCASSSTANPGLIAPIFTHTNPSGVVNVVGGFGSGCTGSGSIYCVESVSGDQFNTGWNTSPSVNPYYVININGVKAQVKTWVSTTLAQLQNYSSGTQTGVSYLNFSACKAGTSPSPGGTGNGCAGSTGYDVTIPGASQYGCISEVLDQSSLPGGVSVGNYTNSGGSGADYTSLDDNYMVIVTSGGNAFLGQKTIVSNCIQVAWNQTAIGNGSLTFSHVSDTTFFAAIGGGTYGTAVNKCLITPGTYPTPPTYSCSVYFDYFAGGGTSGGPPCPGVTPFPALGLGGSGPGEWGTDQYDHRFGAMWGPGGQGTAYWIFDYDVSLPGCTSANFVTGNVYGAPTGGFCTTGCSPSTAPFGTMQGTVNTTLQEPIETTGVHVASVASVANLRVGDYLIIDPGSVNCASPFTCPNQETVQITAVQTSPPTFTANFTYEHQVSDPVQGTSCWGAPGAGSGNNFHETVTPLGGGWVLPSITGNGSWTQGACAGDTNQTQAIWFVPGTLNLQFVDDTATFAWGSHSAEGIVNAVSPDYRGPNLRNMNSPQGPPTIFFPGSTWSTIKDTHSPDWPHYCAGTGTTPNDNCLWALISDEVSSPQSSAGTGNCPSGTSAVYCPTYLNNQIFAINPNGSTSQTPLVFYHTYSCNPAVGAGAKCTSGTYDPFGPGNAIGNESPPGTSVCWATTVLQSLGVDNTGAYAATVLCGRL